MTEFFAMGGYAAYVWPAYGVAAVVMVGLLVGTLRGLRKHERLLSTLEGERPRRRRTGVSAGQPVTEGGEG